MRNKKTWGFSNTALRAGVNLWATRFMSYMNSWLFFCLRNSKKKTYSKNENQLELQAKPQLLELNLGKINPI